VHLLRLQIVKVLQLELGVLHHEDFY
jgi:hypothetical protein